MQSSQQPERRKSATISILKLVFGVGVGILAIKGAIAFVQDYQAVTSARTFDQTYIGQSVGTELKSPLAPPLAPRFTTAVDKNKYLVVDTVINTNGYASPYCAYIRLRNTSQDQTLKGNIWYEQSAPLKGDQSVTFSLSPGEWKVMIPYYKKDLTARRYMINITSPGQTDSALVQKL